MHRTNVLMASVALAVLLLTLASRVSAQPVDWERPPELDLPEDSAPSQLTVRLAIGASAGEMIGVVAEGQIVWWGFLEDVPEIGLGARAYGESYFSLFTSNGADGAAQLELAVRTGRSGAWAYLFVAAGAGSYLESGDDCGLQIWSDDSDDCNDWTRSGTGVSTSAGVTIVHSIGDFNLSVGGSIDGILPDHARGTFTLGLGGTFDL